MRLVPALITLVAFAVPSVAPAATVGGKQRSRDGTRVGTMTFRAGSGVANRVTVTPIEPYSTFRVTDRAEGLRARGDCKQDGRHSAICPWTESDDALIVLASDGADRVDARGWVDVLVRGGGGDDVLLGNGDQLFGDRGDDRLRGGSGWDRLHGGPGRDHVDGRGGSKYLNDIFYDDETDAQAARDVYLARSNNRAELDYSKRTRDLRIDLHDRRIAPEGDRIDGVKGLKGGSGDDRFVGTGGKNRLQGGPGKDKLYGRNGHDHLSGGKGNDSMFGEAGDDWLTEGPYWDSTASGRDKYRGGPGSDEIDALDSLDDDEFEADDVLCQGSDQPVESDPKDRLRGCARIVGWDAALGDLEARVQPELAADGAAFRFTCGATESEQQTEGGDIEFRCRGRIEVRASSGGTYGAREFVFPAEVAGPEEEHTVTVPLTDAGRAAVERGDVITVVFVPLSSNGYDLPAAGYRARLDSAS